MTSRLVKMKINRISFVKRPANRRRFVLMKSAEDEDEIELAKQLSHHLEGVLDAIGESGDPERRERIDQLIEVMDEGGDEAMNRLLGFLRTAQELKMLLSSVVKDDGDEDDEGDEEIDKADDDEDTSPTWAQVNSIARRLEKEATTMDTIGDVEIPLGGGAVLRAKKGASIRATVEDALVEMAGAEVDPDKRTPQNYTDKLLTATRRSREARALFALQTELSRDASIRGGGDMTVAEWLAQRLS